MDGWKENVDKNPALQPCEKIKKSKSLSLEKIKKKLRSQQLLRGVLVRSIGAGHKHDIRQ